jgi:predicted GNAT family N-acyltransferase
VVRIQRITRDDPLYAQERALREAVLLGPIGLSMAKFRALFPGVEERFEHFVAVFDHPGGARVVGCALLLADEGTGAGKLMQMAVDAQRQGEGIGKLLVVTVESRAFGELGLAELYCHARDTACGFYASLGWQVDSERFMEAGIPHYRMAVRQPVEVEDGVGEQD